MLHSDGAAFMCPEIVIVLGLVAGCLRCLGDDVSDSWRRHLVGLCRVRAGFSGARLISLYMKL